MDGLLAFGRQPTSGCRQYNFDFNFNKKMNRSLVFELASGAFLARREDALFLGPPGSGKSHLAQAIGEAVSSSRDIASSTAKLTPCSMSSPKPRWTAHAKNALNRW